MITLTGEDVVLIVLLILCLSGISGKSRGHTYTRPDVTSSAPTPRKIVSDKDKSK